MLFFARIWKFLLGYVNVTVEGFFLEKFTNLCVINNIPFWNIKRYGNAKMVGRTSITGFKNMRAQAKKCGCRINLGKRCGAPFFLHKYRKRKLFVLGFLIFVICIKVSGMFIWNINVFGNENIDKNEILKTLSELGVKKWVKSSTLDVRNIANLFIAKRDDVNWVGIDVDGIQLNVEVVEKPKVPDRVDKDVPCDIIAGKPALIVSMDTYQGSPMVSVGDIVDGGTILVTGVMEMKQFPEKTQSVHALANIKGKVWYERSRAAKLSPLRSIDEVEMIAYNLAYKNIIDEMPEDAEIINTSKSVAYTDEKVIVTVTIECIEEIGVEVRR